MKCIWDFKHGKMAKDESGYIMVMSLFVLIIASAVGVGLVVVGVNEFNLSLRTKLMEQAYAIAEAGINRATLQIQLDDTLCSSCGTNNFYMVDGSTPQWPAGDINGKTESFAGGSYTVTLWQSERTSPANERIDPTHKVVRSTGTITQSGTTAERTIEARVVTGPINTEYDASFDYCIYNGFNEEGGAGTWGPNASGQLQWKGNWLIDGATPDANGRYPKGAIYTKGNINMPVGVFGRLNIQGHVVATNNIAIQNSWSGSWSSPGIQFSQGNVVAGLNRDHLNDDTDNNNIRVRTAATGGGTSALKIWGNLVAAKDIRVEGNFSANWDGAINVGGIKAGRDVSISGTASIGTSVAAGNIISGRKTNINSGFGNVTTGSISAGQHTNGDGVTLSATLGTINTGAITARGKAYASATAAAINTGDLYVGNDVAGEGGGGTGVDWQILFAFSNVGNVRSTGAVYWNWIPLISWISHGSVTTPYWPKPTAPTVDVLSEAGLSAPVELVEPSWSYFQNEAAEDDRVNGPNVKKCSNCRRAVEGDGELPPNFPANCPFCGTSLAGVKPGPAHIVWDRAAGEPEGTGGDYGPANDGYIDIKWDNTLPYSSNETVYNGDASKIIRIKALNLTNVENNEFTGTIVGKNDVLVDAQDTDWFISGKHTLNICSGRDIKKLSGGLTLWERDNSQFHFWAKRNIDLSNLRFNFVGSHTFYGSFTAGNKVIYSDNSFVDNTTFRWSRWALKSQGWANPVRILNYKEI